jgi:predicted DNA-binding transcriptional regulator AlpA
MANLIRIAVVAEKLGGIHESHAWRKLGNDPAAPKPIRLGARHTVFDEAEVDAWILGMIEKAKGKPAKSSLPSADAVRRGAETRRTKNTPAVAR